MWVVMIAVLVSACGGSPADVTLGGPDAVTADAPRARDAAPVTTSGDAGAPQAADDAAPAPTGYQGPDPSSDDAGTAPSAPPVADAGHPVVMTTPDAAPPATDPPGDDAGPSDPTPDAGPAPVVDAAPPPPATGPDGCALVTHADGLGGTFESCAPKLTASTDSATADADAIATCTAWVARTGSAYSCQEHTCRTADGTAYIAGGVCTFEDPSDVATGAGAHCWLIAAARSLGQVTDTSCTAVAGAWN